MSTELAVPTEAPSPAPTGNLFGVTNPEEITRRAVAIAEELGPALRDRGLTKTISGRQYVVAEGWQMLGGLLGLSSSTEWTRPLPHNWDGKGRPYGWEARVEIRTLDGRLVAAGEASCMRDERSWEDRDDYALRSMAQTRALGKAYRMGLAYIVSIAGYEATPAEEIPSEGFSDQRRPTSRPANRDGEPSCPACAAQGFTSGVWENDTKPFYRCKSKECAWKAHPSNPKGYVWAGWHESFANSVEEWAERLEGDTITRVEFDPAPPLSPDEAPF